jgi:hypothetical protein
MTRQAAREKYVETIEKLLLGPLGEANEILNTRPSSVYTTGILWSRESRFDKTKQEDLLCEEQIDDNPGHKQDSVEEKDSGIAGFKMAMPCSIGISFRAHKDHVICVGLGTTSRYVEEFSEPKDAEAKNRKQEGRWRRLPLEFEFRKKFEQAESVNCKAENLPTGIRIHFKAREPDKAGYVSWTLTLVNETEVPEGNQDVSMLFQTQLVVRCLDLENNSVPFAPLEPPERRFSNPEILANEFVFRKRKTYAVGHGTAAQWNAGTNMAPDIVQTSWMPRHEIRQMDAAGHPMLKVHFKASPDSPLSATFLAEGDKARIISSLKSLHSCYTDWIQERSSERLPVAEHDLFNQAFDENIKKCRYAADRIADGIECLNNDENAMRAFRWANEAMNSQSQYKSKRSPRPLEWRPFQLAFLLSVIKGLVAPSHPSRNDMDLLWFPTGGGKTEAYLGIVAFQIFHRRLVREGRASGCCDVIMRYTLRLLTVQQFQRACSLICACEVVRQKNIKDLGENRFTVGLFVGGDTTPNYFSRNFFQGATRSAEWLLAQSFGTAPFNGPTPRQILECPDCGHKILSDSYSIDSEKQSFVVHCRNDECRWSKGNSESGLPFQTIDEHLYREPPSLLIGTIDKFAQIPKDTKFRALFGLDNPDSPRPALIIQDELHLISGQLGSISGLYEAALDLFCTKEHPPKIIGSTATIGQAAEQVKALYGRSVMQFPPSGTDADDSFFAVLNKESPGRLYVGFSTLGAKSSKFYLQVLMASCIHSGNVIRNKLGFEPALVDPYWTNVIYFNSMRELGGAYVMAMDDVPKQIRFFSEMIDCEEIRNGSGRPPEELSSNKSSSELPEILEKLNHSLGRSPDFNVVDTLLATNMLSVGIDIERLGSMIVCGQPKSTAETIQCTSRVGRGVPGVVFMLYNASKPRDISHFEHFVDYHNTIYKHVEAVSVTPFAPRALDKSLHAAVYSIFRHLVTGLRDSAEAFGSAPLKDEVARFRDAFLKRIKNSCEDFEVEAVEREINNLLSAWEKRAEQHREENAVLNYTSAKETEPRLMFDAERPNPSNNGMPTQNSMRGVEPTTWFQLKRLRD